MTRSTIWARIAATLSAEIASGHYAPGDKLPTEATLAQRFGVNRHTVRHALANMASEGAVYARRGAGVFVAAVTTNYPLGRRVRFQQNVLTSGRSPSRQILRSETRPCDPREAEALIIAPNSPVHVIEGLSFADGVVLAMFSSVFPALRFPDFLAQMLAAQSVSAVLATNGVADYTRHNTKINAVAADALLALHLRVAQGAPILRSTAVNVDEAGKPVEFGTTWFAGERVTMTLAADALS
jgi:GntR family phosphonate transport system transcriptional regulator